MRTSFFLYASVMAAAIMCSACDDRYDPSQPVDPNADEKFTVEATLPGAKGEGMKTEFLSTDCLIIRFADASGAIVGKSQILRNDSVEGASASFSASDIEVPDNAATVYAFVDNASSAVNLGEFPSVDDLSTQKGTLADAVAHQVISGSAAIVDGKASVALAYKTAIVKAEVSYPEGVTPTAGTTITLAFNQYDKVVFEFDATSESTRGNITVPATVDETSAYAYIAVWGKLGKGMLVSNIGDTMYGCDIDASAVTAGKTFNLTKSVKVMTY